VDAGLTNESVEDEEPTGSEPEAAATATAAAAAAAVLFWNAVGMALSCGVYQPVRPRYVSLDRSILKDRKSERES
jgi:uncharacterized protein HemX